MSIESRIIKSNVKLSELETLINRTLQSKNSYSLLEYILNKKITVSNVLDFIPASDHIKYRTLLVIPIINMTIDQYLLYKRYAKLSDSFLEVTCALLAEKPHLGVLRYMVMREFFPRCYSEGVFEFIIPKIREIFENDEVLLDSLDYNINCTISKWKASKTPKKYQIVAHNSILEHIKLNKNNEKYIRII